jgi:hypothetical protein
VLASGFGYGAVEERLTDTVRVRFPWGVLSVPYGCVHVAVDLDILYFEPNAQDFDHIRMTQIPINTPLQHVVVYIADKLTVHPEYVRLAHRGVEIKHTDNVTIAQAGIWDPTELLCVLQREPHLIAAKLIQEMIDNLNSDAFTDRWEKKERTLAFKMLANVSSPKDLANVLFLVEKCLHRRVLVEMWEFFRKTWVSILGNITSVRSIAAWVWFFLQFVKTSAISEVWLESQQEEWQERTIRFILEDSYGQFVCVQLCLLHVQAHIRSHCYSEEWSDWEWRLQWLTDALNVKYADTNALSYLFSVLGNNIQHRYFKEGEDGVPIPDWIQGWIASLDSLAKNESKKLKIQAYSEHLISLTDRLDDSALDEEWSASWESWRYVLELISASPKEFEASLKTPPVVPPPVPRASNNKFKLKREITGSVQFEDAVKVVDSSRLERINEDVNEEGASKSEEEGVSKPNEGNVWDEANANLSWNEFLGQSDDGEGQRQEPEGIVAGKDALDVLLDGVVPIPPPVLKRSST